MMNNLTFTVPLTRAAHLEAQQICRYHAKSQKVKQIYLNSLAVYAVNYYLNCLGFKTNLQSSDRADLSFQTLSDTADLVVENWGKLECRPVLPNSKVCKIPPEVWHERDGYVAVQFDPELSEATLLGFRANVNAEEIALDRFDSLESLLKYLHTPVKNVPQQAIDSSMIKLSNWFNNIVELGWETLGNLLEPPPDCVALNFRRPSPTKVERGKLIHLDRQDEQVALVVSLLPTTQPEIDISVEVLPSRSSHLPSDLCLIVLDENDRAVMQAEAGGSEGLEFQFSGEPGEQFSVAVALGDFRMTERFII